MPGPQARRRARCSHQTTRGGWHPQFVLRPARIGSPLPISRRPHWCARPHAGRRCPPKPRAGQVDTIAALVEIWAIGAMRQTHYPVSVQSAWWAGPPARKAFSAKVLRCSGSVRGLNSGQYNTLRTPLAADIVHRHHIDEGDVEFPFAIVGDDIVDIAIINTLEGPDVDFDLEPSAPSSIQAFQDYLHVSPKRDRLERFRSQNNPREWAGTKTPA